MPFRLTTPVFSAGLEGRGCGGKNRCLVAHAAAWFAMIVHCPLLLGATIGSLDHIRNGT